jgi:L-histidine N-alpha-methyltransferase
LDSKKFYSTEVSNQPEKVFNNSDKQDQVKIIFEGLTLGQKQISSMYFYDKVGSKLFEEITQLPEYYLTRLEKSLIPEASRQLSETDYFNEIIELGSGDSSKILLLLQNLNPPHRSDLTYKPVDISSNVLRESLDILKQDFPEVRIDIQNEDFISFISHLKPSKNRRTICFFGSTLGNLTDNQSKIFFNNLGKGMNFKDRLLLGVDMVKDRTILERAYNDRRGITAQFNQNILNVINSIAKTNFKIEKFKHKAFYCEKYEQIEMHLQAIDKQMIESTFWNREIVINKGETIRTEISRKFTKKVIEKLATIAGLEVEKIYSDQNSWFTLYQFVKVPF